MPTQCSATGMGFGRAGGRELVAAFDGGRVTSEAGALLLGATDQAIRLVDRFAACFRDGRHPAFVTHRVRSLVGSAHLRPGAWVRGPRRPRDLRHDPVLGALLGRFKPGEAAPAPLAGKSTLNRLEHAPVDATARYHKIGHDAAAIEAVVVDLFLDAFRAKPPRDIILDLDATDDPIHGHQEGRFFHGYYDCYCYLPLYIFCGRHLLAAKLRRSNIDASAGAVEEVQRIIGQIRARWPRVKIVLRADAGFARETLMVWCE
jgi:DDE family transposase